MIFALTIELNVQSDIYAGLIRYRYVVTCDLPQNNLNYTHISITTNLTNPIPFTNFAPILYPLPYEKTCNKSIGVCGGNMYNIIDKKKAFQFVNWMEALLMFGVKEVTIKRFKL